MKKIAYIELDTHAEIAQNVMELMKDSNVFKVDYYFSEKIIKQIKNNESTIFFSENTELLNQLSQHKYDLVIIGTVHRYFNLFKEITEKYNTSIIVHNLNFTRISKVQLFKSIFLKDFAYRVKLLFKENLLSAPKVFKNAKNLLVLDESIVDFDFSPTHSNTTFLKYFPLFFNQFNVKNNSKIFAIVIPGAVSQQRRDYNKVISIISDLEKSIKSGFNFNEKIIEFVFLGKAKGNELKKIIDLERSLEIINIKYFTEKVPQKLFDEWMNKADFLWCPIQEKTAFFSNQEFYGKTKMSGNIGDAIKYGKLALFPENYQTDHQFLVSSEKDMKSQFQKMDKVYFDFQLGNNKDYVLKKLEKILNDL